MKEKPILFSGEMVRALLNTKPDAWPPEPIDESKPCKGQTRRIAEFVPREPGLNMDASSLCARHYFTGSPEHGWVLTSRDNGCWSDKTYPLKPKYRVGDTLWVRENLGTLAEGSWIYVADSAPVMVDPVNTTAMIAWAHHKKLDYCSSIHMPRWASRLTLKVMGVRCERVNHISEEDARLEGVTNGWPRDKHPNFIDDMRYKASYSDLWNRINGDGSWESNPWVWVYEVMRISSARRMAA